jgi:hypothetical protein
VFDEPIVTSCVFSVDKLKQELEKTVVLLRSSDFNVEAQLFNLKEFCKSTDYEQDIINIIEYVDDIEFENATQTTLELITQLDVVFNE